MLKRFLITILLGWCVSQLHAQPPRIYGGYLFDQGVAGSPVNAGQYFNQHLFRAVYFVATADIARMPRNNGGLTIRVRQKRDNTEITRLFNNQTEIGPEVQYLSACGERISITKFTYLFQLYEFNPRIHLDANGYKVISDPLGVRVTTDNLASTATPAVFYMEIGPVDQIEYKAGNAHTPTATFLPTDKYEICTGQEINIPSPILKQGQPPSPNLTLKYSFARPHGIANELDWKSGFSDENFTGSSAPFRIDANTGSIIGKADKVGVFSYVIKVEAFQGSTKYSEIRYEFVLSVRDCRPNPKPTIFVSKVGQPNVPASTTVCQDSAIQLNLRGFARGSTFQWQLGGVELAGKKDSFLVVANRQGGTYSGSATFASTCPPTVASEVVNVFFVANPTVNITSTAPTGTLCQGGTVRLLASTTTSNPKFQWLHENKEIENASAAIFEASVSGIYIVKVTDPRGCVGISNALTVVTNTPPTAKITADARTMCPGQRLLLSATLTTGANYEWLKNGQPIANANQPNLTVNEAGSYKVRITSPNTCSTLSDPFEVRQVSAPVVQITAPSQQICQNSSLVLTANSTTSQTYQWYRNGQALSGATQKIYETREVGNFTVAVTDSNRCQNTSAAFEVSEIPSIRVTLDSIPLFCGTNAPPISLKGNPAGGIFSGKGVSNSIFDPQVASVGQHVITYTIQGANPCMSGTARRMAIVVDVPILELGENKKIMLGKTVQLNGDLGGNYRYQWTPATALSDPQMATPTALPEQTTTYHLRAVDANGCTVTDSITIFVLQGIYIPDVFTPNGDGINDTWEIKGLEAYPEAQLVIFDRWGIPVFHADRLQIQKFDGTYQGQPLPEGSYAFVLRTSSDEHIYRGNLMLMR